MRQLMPIKPSLVSAWTGRTWGRCWCLTQCSTGLWVCVVCPGTSAEEHILKAEVEKMRCTAEINPLSAPAERVLSEQGVWQSWRWRWWFCRHCRAASGGDRRSGELGRWEFHHWWVEGVRQDPQPFQQGWGCFIRKARSFFLVVCTCHGEADACGFRTWGFL